MEKLKDLKALKGFLSMFEEERMAKGEWEVLPVRCSVPLIQRKTAASHMTMDEVDIIMRTAHPPIYKKHRARVAMGRF